MIPDLRLWRRVLKLDPARALSERRLRAVQAWLPDAVVVGGSGGYGAGEVLSLLLRLRRLGCPLVLEISDAAALCPGFDLYLVPMVLNSRDAQWIVGQHQAAIKRFAQRAEWDRLAVEGYCILNPDSTAAAMTRADAVLARDDVLAYAHLAGHLLHLPIFYLEYSGMYGDPDVVRAVTGVLEGTRLWYGGGITSETQLRAMAAWADTVVVGNAVYDEERGEVLLEP